MDKDNGEGKTVIRRLLTIVMLAPLLMAQQCASTQTATAPSTRAPGSDIGVVLMHGKSGIQGGPVAPLASRLRAAGFPVVTPDMPWSRSRRLSRDVDGSLAEISAAAARLRAAGAKRIVIAGHSMGAVTAAAYATRHKVAGLILIAPGHYVFAPDFQNAVNHDWRRAERMIKAGRGGETAGFGDVNLGRNATVATTARIYSSWYRPNGPIDMMANLPKMMRGTPVLWISATDDPLNRATERFGLRSLVPAHPKNRQATVSASHRRAPRAASSIVIDWLHKL